MKTSKFIVPPPVPTDLFVRDTAWVEGQKGSVLVMSGDCAGLTLVARWVRTPKLLPIPEGMPASEYTKGPPENLHG